MWRILPFHLFFDTISFPHATIPSAALTPSTSATGAASTPIRVWKRLYEVTDIRRLVELLGASEGESALKKSIINALLLERSVATAAAGACVYLFVFFVGVCYMFFIRSIIKMIFWLQKEHVFKHCFVIISL